MGHVSGDGHQAAPLDARRRPGSVGPVPGQAGSGPRYGARLNDSLFRLELGHRVNNPASCGVAMGAGFVAKGIQRQKLRYGVERFDVQTHTRLRTDPYPALELLPVRC